MDNFFDAPRTGYRYDFVILVNCATPGINPADFLIHLKAVLKGLDHSFGLLLVGSEYGNELKEMAEEILGGYAPIDFRILQQPEVSDINHLLPYSLPHLWSLGSEYYIIMNADGTDDPQVIPQLIAARGKKVVFVNKGPRTDKLTFWIAYRFHQALLRMVTGKEIEVDHYSMIQRKVLQDLLNRPFIHYAAALQFRQPKTHTIRHEHPIRDLAVERRRLHLTTILTLVEFGEGLLISFLRFAMLMGFLLFGGLIYTGLAIFFTGIGVPDWMPWALSGIFLSLLLSMGFFSLGALLINRHRLRLAQSRATPVNEEKLISRFIDN